MAGTDDEDEFGFDDDLDDLPENDLYQLERDAFLSTQRNPSNLALSPAHGKNARIQHAPESYESDRTLQPNRPPSDYGLDDEDIIDLDNQPLAVQQAYRKSATYSNGCLGQPESNSQYEAGAAAESFQTAVEQPQVDVARITTLLEKVTLHYLCIWPGRARHSAAYTK
jgi:hypothetical protein